MSRTAIGLSRVRPAATQWAEIPSEDRDAAVKALNDLADAAERADVALRKLGLAPAGALGEREQRRAEFRANRGFRREADTTVAPGATPAVEPRKKAPVARGK
jgi:hypothetical protein